MIESLEQEGKCTLEYVQDTKRISTLKAKVHVSVTSGIDWFDTEVALELDHEEVNAGEKLLEAIKNNKKYISLDDGSLLMIRDEMRQSLLSLESLGIDPTKTGAQKLGRYMIGTLDTEKDSLLHFSLDREALRLQKSLLNFRSLPKVKIPKTLKATLRAYQETGFSWIHFLEAERFCGILADDMGLGKTIQTITFLLDFLARKSTGAPILIICPTSLIFNWRTEIERFAPSIRVISVTSGKWDKEEIGDAQVVLTTYGIIQRSVDIFTPITWSTLILDEAQNIKNASSVRAKNIRLLTSTFRLALSGTPIENHLMELKSIFDVLMPGFLGSDADFKRRYMS